MRRIWLPCLILLLRHGQPVDGAKRPCSFQDQLEGIAAPVYDREPNLSWKNCGQRSASGAAPWRVAIGSEGGRWCYGVLLSNKTILTANCRETADDFLKDKSKFKARFGTCYDQLLGTQTCDSKHQIQVANVVSIKKLRDVHVWTIQQDIATEFTPICLFNKGPRDVSKYSIYDRRWSDEVEANLEGTPVYGERDAVCVKAKNLPERAFTFDFLVSVHKGRTFLRGFYHWDLDEMYHSFIDVLPMVRKIVAPSSDLYVMPILDQKPQVDIKGLKGINLNECGTFGRSVNYYRRRRRSEEAPRAEALLGAHHTQIHQHPWHVFLRVVNDGKCAATIIADKIIITAAHCLKDVTRASQMTATFGMTDLDEVDYVKKLTPSSFEIHPDFRHVANGPDVALVFFDESFNLGVAKVRQVCVWDEDYAIKDIANKNGTIVGWGIDETGDLSHTLRSAEVNMVSHEECYFNYPKFFGKYLNPSLHICVGGNGTVACPGDSGGGLFIKRNEKWYIRGIVSFGISENKVENECKPKNPSIFADLGGSMKWIKDTILEHTSYAHN